MTNNISANEIQELRRFLGDFNKEQSQYLDNLKRLKQQELEIMLSMIDDKADNSTKLKKAYETEIAIREEIDKEILDLQKIQTNLKKDILAEENAVMLAENNQQKEHFENKLLILQEEEKLNNQAIELKQLLIDGELENYALRKAEFEKINYQQQEELKQRENNNAKLKTEQDNELETRRNLIQNITKISSDAWNTFINTYTSAISSVTNAYEQHASKLSAILDVTVEDITTLQNNIADSLQNSNLSEAISNVAVLNEISSLSSSGYTDQTTLQQNAVDIVVGKQVSPTTDFDNSTVKNLINIFGSDFTTKFTAIQQAAQETAGSAINISNNLSSLMTNLEPVYMNAQYQQAALQGSADVTATLAKAREEGVITQAQESEYMTMLNELMDPSKAFKSSNLAVKVAATQYDFNGNPADALAALISANQQYYNNVDQSSSYSGNVSRSLAASVAGNNTMSATYNAQGLTDLQLISANDLDETYEEQLASLTAGDNTTAKQSIQNAAENSDIVQTVADFATSFPRTFNVMQTAILGAINSLPIRLGNVITKQMTTTNKTNIGSSTNTGTNTNGTTNKNLMSTLNTATIGGSTSLANKASQAVGGRTGTLANLSYSAGLIGGMNIIDNVSQSGANLQGFGMNGDVGSAALSYGGVGSAIGSLIAPGLGTAIGAAVGAIGGLTVSLLASAEQEKLNTLAMEEQTSATKEMLGGGIQSLSAMESAEKIGTISINSQTYEIDTSKVTGYASGLDYVPYDDYLVRLHKGESVVTAEASDRLRKQDSNYYNRPSNDFQSMDIVNSIEKQTQSLSKAFKNEDIYDTAMTMAQGPKQYTIANPSYN